MLFTNFLVVFQWKSTCWLVIPMLVILRLRGCFFFFWNIVLLTSLCWLVHTQPLARKNFTRKLRSFIKMNTYFHRLVASQTFQRNGYRLSLTESLNSQRLCHDLRFVDRPHLYEAFLFSLLFPNFLYRTCDFSNELNNTNISYLKRQFNDNNNPWTFARIFPLFSILLLMSAC